jgi:Ca-activated chloride channel family protein
VTALYEILPVGKPAHSDPLRYGPPLDNARSSDAANSPELAFVRVRYKRPEESVSRLLEYPVARASIVAAGETSADFRFAASVAAFGQKLRNEKYIGDFDYNAIRRLATEGLSADREGYRREFVSLVQLAESLDTSNSKQQRVGRTDEVLLR